MSSFGEDNIYIPGSKPFSENVNLEISLGISELEIETSISELESKYEKK